MRYFAICLIVLFLLGCDRSQVLDKKDWKWIKTIDTSGQAIEPIKPDAFIVSLDFDLNKFTARTDCNRFFCSFSLSGKNIKFSNIGSTRMRCAASQEQVFIKQLEKSTHYKILENTKSLVLEALDGSEMYFDVL